MSSRKESRSSWSSTGEHVIDVDAHQRQETHMSDNAPLTVVLVHGAFADASSWNGVVERMQAAGLQVSAPANPLRGISHDSAYIASFLEQIPRPSQPAAVAEVILTAAAVVDEVAAATGGGST
jgi:alpha-beta hydrolase superfamily lysophospholipase